MGSFVELNDTLQITTEQGFPADILVWEKHEKSPISIDEVADKIFEFKDKPNARLYHSPPNRNYLAHNIDGKWLYWGEIMMIEQTIHSDKTGENKSVSGKFKIIKLYDPHYMIEKTKNEANPGESYF